jgi:hypothetical protein
MRVVSRASVVRYKGETRREYELDVANCDLKHFRLPSAISYLWFTVKR